MNPDTILSFWFEELQPADWFNGGAELDARIKERFQDVHDQARHGELYQWRDDAAGRLAEIIILDQFSRNIYRGTPQAFAADPIALILAQEAIRAGCDTATEPERREFFYLPFMHSESKAAHAVAVTLYQNHGSEGGLEFEHKHKAIIDRFGRYPHRNGMLGRTSTPEELEFLATPGSSF